MVTPSYDKIPVAYMTTGVRRYIEDGQPVGDFLTALFENNLMAAVNHADPMNLSLLREWVLFLHWETPSESHGSAAKVKAWRYSGGLRGRKAA